MQGWTISGPGWTKSQAPLALGMLGAILAASALYTAVPLLILIVVPASLYFISRPYQLLCVMAFFIPFNFIVMVGPVPIAVELLKIAIWIPLISQALLHDKPILSSRYDLLFLGVGLSLAMSCVHATNLAFTFKECLRFASSIGLVYVVINLVDTREKLIAVLKAAGISAFIVALYGIYQFAIGDFGALFFIVNPRVTTSLAPSRGTEFWEWRHRITSFLSSEMEAGDYLNYCFAIASSLMLYSAERWRRNFWFITAILCFIALFLTFTFGSWIACAVAIAVLAFRYRAQMRLRFVLPAAAIVVGISAIGVTLYSALLQDKIAQIAWDYMTRYEFWALAWNAFASHPILGIGMGNYASMALAAGFDWLAPEWAISITPHNMYLTLLSQLGLVGAISTIGVFAHATLSMGRISRTFEGGFKWICHGFQFAFICLLVAGLTDDSTIFGPHSSYMAWMLLGLSESAYRVATGSATSLPAVKSV
jgi:O-antigen ligase